MTYLNCRMENDDLRSAIAKAIEAEDRTVSWIMRKALSEWLKAKGYLK